MFIGTYEAKLNKNNQYKLPKPILQELENRKTDGRKIIYTETKTAIRVYAERDIQKYFEETETSPLNQNTAMMRRITAQYGESSYTLFGATQIPEMFIKHIKIQSPTKIVLKGCGDYFEISEDPRMILRDLYL